MAPCKQLQSLRFLRFSIFFGLPSDQAHSQRRANVFPGMQYLAIAVIGNVLAERRRAAAVPIVDVDRHTVRVQAKHAGVGVPSEWMAQPRPADPLSTPSVMLRLVLRKSLLPMENHLRNKARWE